MNSTDKKVEAFDSYVVFDCDIGTDDAWALLMLLRAETYTQSLKEVPSVIGPGKFKVAGITCVQGNTDVHNGTLNALRVLTTINRLDVPVYKGCTEPIVPRSWKRVALFHGVDGFGDLAEYPPVDEHNLLIHNQEHAVNAMYRLACEHSHQVDFLLCGPLTNFALCINIYGEDFLNKVRNIYIMGGNINGKGNVSKCAEFNFLMDPEAAHIVLARIKDPVWILPWETCLDGDCALTLDWRFNVLGSVQSAAMDLLNRAERTIINSNGLANWLICDGLLVAAYLFPTLIIEEERSYHGTVELSGIHTRGQMVLDRMRRVSETTHNMRVIRKLDAANFKHIIAWTGELKDVCIEDMWKNTNTKRS